MAKGPQQWAEFAGIKFPKVIIKGKPDQQEQAHHPLRSSLQLVDPAIQLRHKGFYTLTNEDKNN